MTQHHTPEEKSYDYLYYVIGLVFGLITGFFLDKSFVWVLVGGLFGLLTAAFFVNVLVKGREQKV